MPDADQIREEAARFEISAHCIEGLVAYFTERRPVGSFLQAVLSNDLYSASIMADDKNIFRLKAYSQFLLAIDVPPESYGNEPRYRAWIAGGRNDG